MIDRLISEALNLGLDKEARDIQDCKLSVDYMIYKINSVDTSMNTSSIKQKLLNVGIAFDSTEVIHLNSFFDEGAKYSNDEALKKVYMKNYSTYFKTNNKEANDLLKQLILLKKFDESNLLDYNTWLKTKRRKDLIDDITDINLCNS
jgi:hypothetical protein